MRQSVHYLIALPAPLEIAQAINRLRRQFGVSGDHATRVLAPHITVIRPFTLLVSEAEFLTRFRLIVSQQTSFTIESAGYGDFPEQTVFVAVSPVRNLNRLHELLEALFLEDIQGRGSDLVYVPHLTIMHHLRGRSWEKARQIVRANPDPPTFTWLVNEIALYRMESGIWHEIACAGLSHPIPALSPA